MFLMWKNEFVMNRYVLNLGKKLALAAWLCAASVMPVAAQTYETLWKDVQAAQQKDLPKTVLTAVRHIYDKAQTEGNRVEQMKAMLVLVQQGWTLSPDTARVFIKEFEAMSDAPDSVADGALRHALLGSAYTWISAGRSDTAAVSAARRHVRQALQPMETLRRASAKDYQPLFAEGKDSRLFGDDVLSVVLRSVCAANLLPREECAAAYGQAVAGYLADGNRAADLLLRLDSLDAVSADNYNNIEVLHRMVEEYADLPQAVYASIALCRAYQAADIPQADSLANAAARTALAHYGKTDGAAWLRNFLKSQEQPKAEIADLPTLCLPGRAYTVAVKARNLKKAGLRFLPLELTAYDYETGEWTIDKLRKIAGKAVLAVTKTLRAVPPYAEQTDSLTFCLNAPGLYLCELLADGRCLSREVVSVSGVRALRLAVSSKEIRVILVDGATGKPLKGGAVKAYCTNTRSAQAVYQCDSMGQVLLPRGNYSLRYFASHGKDAFAPAFNVPSGFFYDGNADDRLRQSWQIFTDRSIYRPGQAVRFGGICFTRQGDAFQTMPNCPLTVRLYDTNHRQLAETQLLTDAFGTVSGCFDLPSVVLPGLFSIEAKATEGSGSAYCSIRVEEYKRPAFTVTIDQPAAAYAPGDTLCISGTVRTYTGLPVSDAEVAWRLSARTYWRASNADDKPQSGLCVTDSAGHFSVNIVVPSLSSRKAMPYNIYIYELACDVTAEGGETNSASLSLRTASRRSWLSAEWPQTICKEMPGMVLVRRTNAAGAELGGKGMYRIFKDGATVFKGRFTAGESFSTAELAGLPSGAYAAALAVGEDTYTVRFTIFSEHDVRTPAPDRPLWHYVRLSAARDSALVLVGSPCKDATLFYDVFGNGRLVESHRIVLNDTLLRLELEYKPEWGESGKAWFALMRDGELHSFSVNLLKPAPDKSLRLQWTTFRSALTPGKEEQWRLRVTHTDGRPADASLMATLYDASLDAFGAMGWSLTGTDFHRATVYNFWNGGEQPAAMLAGCVSYKSEKEKQLEFTHWRDELDIFSTAYYPNFRHYRAPVAGMGFPAAAPSKEKLMLKAPVASMDMADKLVATDESAENDMKSVDADAADEGQVRKNFAETAYFQPQLRTDSLGHVDLVFTLPESLTSWRLKLLAHTQAVDYGLLDTTVVARKEFMLQAHMPRFLRSGDRASLPVTLRNLTGNTLAANVTMQIFDAATMRPLAESRQAIQVGANAAALTFACDVPAQVQAVLCRFTAAADGYADGEEHVLPVLADLTEVRRTLPFSFMQSGAHTLRLDTLFKEKKAENRRFIVEMCSNPTWYAVSALPALSRLESTDAFSLAARYYALALGRHIANAQPAVRQYAADLNAGTERETPLSNAFAAVAEETPWLREAEAERQRAGELQLLFDSTAYVLRAQSALDKLAALQNADGSWSWYPKMPGNDYITAQNVLLLSRLQNLAGEQTAAPMAARGFAFLKKSLANAVKEMKEYEGVSHTPANPAVPSRLWLTVVYLYAVRGEKLDENAQFVLERCAEQAGSSDLYAKSLMALALDFNGQKEKASALLESLAEYTVGNAANGRFFDSARAPMFASSYRIPTQTIAIEALSTASEYAVMVDEMRLWLMQSKRTQMWDTSIATADALYCLLAALSVKADVAKVMKPEDNAPLFYTLKAGRTVLADSGSKHGDTNATIGYVRETYTDPIASKSSVLIVQKPSEGLSWGSVTAISTMPQNETAPTGSDLRVTRRFEVWRDGAWQSMETGGVSAKVGDRVRQVATVTAARDFDFVSLRLPRPACFAPRRALSGADWSAGHCYYRAVHDASSELFFEKMPRGTLTVTEEGFIDRAGTYKAGCAAVSCVYAPEYCGSSAAASIAGE